MRRSYVIRLNILLNPGIEHTCIASTFTVISNDTAHQVSLAVGLVKRFCIIIGEGNVLTGNRQVRIGRKISAVKLQVHNAGSSKYFID